MLFFRLKVRSKKEIVTLRTKMVDRENLTGKKIKPEKYYQKRMIFYLPQLQKRQKKLLNMLQRKQTLHLKKQLKIML